MSPTEQQPDTAAWPPRQLTTLRARRNQRYAALVAAVLLGLLAVSVHWIGLVVGGALVGVVSRTLPRAVLAGLGFGLLVLGVHVMASPVMGVGEFVALAPPSYVTIAASLVGPVWGSLLRGVL